jgi:hypothetical protein
MMILDWHYSFPNYDRRHFKLRRAPAKSPDVPNLILFCKWREYSAGWVSGASDEFLGN